MDEGRSKPVIRRATVDDAALVAALGARTFAETFGADNRPDDMAAYLAAAFGLPQQTAELSNPDYVTLLAEVGGAMAGFAQVRRRTPPACVRGPAPVEIQRFYVDRPWHGCGVAAPLMRASLDAVRALGGRSAWLSVWERNPRALAFYAKQGFTRSGAAEFRVGSDCQTDHILERAAD